MERSIKHNGRTGFGSLTPGGMNFDNFAMKLFFKGNSKFWNAADIDFSQDAKDFAAMAPDEQHMTMVLAAHFAAGEESVTQDLQPFAAAMAAEGRLGDEMFLTQFTFEEAKHAEGFRRFFNAIGHQKTDLHQYVEYSEPYKQIFYTELPNSLYALELDPSPANQVRASVTYNHVVEGALALTGYFAWAKVCQSRGILPGMNQLIKNIGDDERRHMAWGTFTCRRHIAADDSNWAVVEERMGELLAPALGLIVNIFDNYEDRDVPFGISIDEMSDYASDKLTRRLSSIESARGADPSVIDMDFSPEQLEEQFHVEDQATIAESTAKHKEPVGARSRNKLRERSPAAQSLAAFPGLRRGEIRAWMRSESHPICLQSGASGTRDRNQKDRKCGMSAHSVPAARCPRTTRPRTPRVTAFAGLVGLCATGLAVLGAGTASAAPTGPPDLVLNSCNTTTQAAPGQRVTLTAQALLAPITTDLNAIPLFGPITLGLLTPVLSAVPLPPFTVQSTPGPQQFSGVDIANQLVSSLKLLLPPGTEGQVRTSVGNGCKVDVNVVAPAAAPTPAHGLAPVPVPAGVPLPGSAATALPVAPLSGLYTPIGNYGNVPEHTYSALTSVPTEGAAGFSTDFAPLPAPAPGVDTSSAPIAGVALSTPAISGMNQVTALPSPPTSSRVPVQDVLAALLLALTTAALVRTWVLRQQPANPLGAHRAQREWAPGARFVGALRGH